MLKVLSAGGGGRRGAWPVCGGGDETCRKWVKKKKKKVCWGRDETCRKWVRKKNIFWRKTWDLQKVSKKKKKKVCWGRDETCRMWVKKKEKKFVEEEMRLAESEWMPILPPSYLQVWLKEFNSCERIYLFFYSDCKLILNVKCSLIFFFWLEALHTFPHQPKLAGMSMAVFLNLSQEQVRILKFEIVLILFA